MNEIILTEEETDIFNKALKKIEDVKENDSLDLSYLKITDNILTELLPSINKLTNLKELNLEHNKLTTIPEGAFNGLINLEDLNLGYNNLITIPEGAFNGLTNLKELNLGCNNLATIPEGAFNGLTNLAGLYLSDNNLTTIPDGAFKGLTALTELYLSCNNLTTIPDGAFNDLTNLAELNLGHNNLTTIPEDDFNGLTALRELNLGNNNLTNIPDNAFNGLTNLAELYLGNNNLTTIPDGAFNGLTSLKKLNLNSNKLQTISDGDFNGLTNLEKLNLENNKIENISNNAFNGLTNLEKLILENNKIENIPDNAFNGLTNVKELNLIGNQLTDLPESIINQNIDNIALYNNPLTQEFITRISNMTNIRFNMARHDTIIHYNIILNTIYPNDTTPQNIEENIDDNDTLKVFLSKVGATNGWQYPNNRNGIIIPTVKFILDKLNQDKEDTIASIETCLGDCATPVNEYIMQNYLAMLNDGKTELPRDIIEKMALTYYIQTKLDKQLPKNERIECLHGLINCMYLSDSHSEYKFAPIKIKNRKYLQPSTTEYVKFGFNLIEGKTVLDNFIELCCKKEGDKIVIDEEKIDKIVRDEEKIDSIYEDFLAKNGIVSEKQKIINKCIDGINNNENYQALCIAHYDKKEVVKLIKSITLPDRFKKETSGMSDKDDINEVCKKIEIETIANIESVRESSNLYDFNHYHPFSPTKTGDTLGGSLSNVLNGNHYSSPLTREQKNLKKSGSLPNVSNVNRHTNKEKSKRRPPVSAEEGLKVKNFDPLPFTP